MTGERFTFTDTATTTGGELLASELGLRSGGQVPVPHVHPIQTERFEVLHGHMRFRIRWRTVVAGPGEVVEVSRTSRTGSPTPETRRPGCGSRSVRPWR